MIKSLSIALTALMGVGIAGITLASDPIGGQPDTQVNTSSQPASPSDSTTGMGTTSKSDVGIEDSLKASTQTAPCAGQGSAQVGADMTMKPQPESNTKSSAAEAAQKAMSNVKKADTVDSDTLRNPEARSSAETRLGASSNPCPENSGLMK